MGRFFGVLSKQIMSMRRTLRFAPPHTSIRIRGAATAVRLGTGCQIIVGGLLLALSITSSTFAAEDISTARLTVSGNSIVNAQGEVVAIHGFNAYGTAQNCDDGFSHVLPNEARYNRSALYFQRMKEQWNVNAFRIMINEWCWKNDISYADRPIANQPNSNFGPPVTHHNAIAEVVNSITSNNMIAVITLAMTRDEPAKNPDGTPNFANRPNNQYGAPSLAMPNETNSREVWLSLANTFKNNSRVIFDAYNEPTPYLCQDRGEGNQCTGVANCSNDFQYAGIKAAQCLRDGRNACFGSGASNNNSQCLIPQLPWVGVTGNCTADGQKGCPLGMQSIVNIIRSTGATNVILVPGVAYAGDLTRWVEYKPTDGQTPRLGASLHRYHLNLNTSSFANECLAIDGFASNSVMACQRRLENSMKQVVGGAQVGASVPVVYTEFGSSIGVDSATGTTPCMDSTYIPAMVNYAIDKKHGYLFHEPHAINDDAAPLNNNCSAYRAFSDYGEGVDRDDVATDDTDNTIEPTNYGAPYKALLAPLSWTYGGGIDTTPNPFNFTPTTNVPLGSTQISEFVTINGINAPATIMISTGSSYNIEGTMAFVTTSGGTIMNGQRVRVAHFAASMGSTVVTTTLNIGGVVGTFSSTTTNADTTPDAFSFTPVNNADTNFAQASPNQITVSGINAATPISISAGSTYQIGTGPYVGTPGTIMNGEVVRVAHFTAATHSTMVTTTLNIGNVLGNFSSTTRAPGMDLIPNAFVFNPNSNTNVQVGSTQVSNFTTIMGIDGNAPISVSSGSSYEINLSGTFVTTPGTITNNSKVRVAHFASPSPGTTITTTLNIGGVTGTFSSTTAQ